MQERDLQNLRLGLEPGRVWGPDLARQLDYTARLTHDLARHHQLDQAELADDRRLPPAAA
jgi:hypothetical protein